MNVANGVQDSSEGVRCSSDGREDWVVKAHEEGARCTVSYIGQPFDNSHPNTAQGAFSRVLWWAR